MKKNYSHLFKKRAVAYLKHKHGLADAYKMKNSELMVMIEAALGLETPCVTGKQKRYKMMFGLLPKPIPTKKKKPKKQNENKKYERFYQSAPWRMVRYDAYEKNDGRCECCGRSAKEGIYLNCDHIKPLREFWKLRLDPENLQILCNECNHGKGNRYSTDWRKGKGMENEL